MDGSASLPLLPPDAELLQAPHFLHLLLQLLHLVLQPLDRFRQAAERGGGTGEESGTTGPRKVGFPCKESQSMEGASSF